MPHLIGTLAVIITTAAVLVYVTHRLGQPSVLAYLLAGILLGPGVLNLVREPGSLSTIGEIGVVFLLFFVGLEFRLEALRRFTRRALGGGGLQIGLSTLLFAGLASLRLEPRQALLTGLMVALSSTALVVKVFEDQDEIDSPTAQTSMAILITQDLAAILAMAALPLILPGQPQAAFRHILVLVVMLPVLYFLYRLALPRILRVVVATRHGELFALTTLAISLSVAAAAELAGASLALGAFLGGVILCESPVAHQIRGDLAPFKHLTLAIFFIWVGTLLNLGIIGRHALPIAGTLVGILLLKSLITTLSLRLIGETTRLALRVGIALSQVGEFSFILAQVAYRQGLLADVVYQGILTVTLLSMALTPIVIGRSDHWIRRFTRALTPPQHLAPPSPAAPHPQAVVVGYGPIGSQLTRALEASHIQTTVIELNMDRVNLLRAEGRNVIFGDAARSEVLTRAGLANAAILVVTIPHLMGRMAVLPVARSINPELRIYVRARYLRERSMLEELGVRTAAYEELEVAVELARQVFEDLGTPREVAQAMLERIRRECDTGC